MISCSSDLESLRIQYLSDFGVNYFEYGLITLDGHQHLFCSSQELYNKYYKDLILKDSRNYMASKWLRPFTQEGFILDFNGLKIAAEMDEYYLKLFQSINIKNIIHFIDYDNNKKCLHYFLFGLPEGQNDGNNIINNLDIFKKVCNTIISNLSSKIKCNQGVKPLEEEAEFIAYFISLLQTERAKRKQVTKKLEIQLHPYSEEFTELAELTKTEKRVMQHVLHGLSAKQISTLLKRSHRTIEWHIKNIREKLSCANKTELVIKAKEYLNN